MGRRDQRRRRKRKQRREARAEGRRWRELGLLPPELRSSGEERRDPRTRWQGLRARGGLELSFVPTGRVVALGELDESAPGRLAAALVGGEEGEA
jgi:hypothetical protein